MSPGPPRLTSVHDGAAPWVFGSTCLWLVFPVSLRPHGQAPSLSLPRCQDCSGVTGALSLHFLGLPLRLSPFICPQCPHCHLHEAGCRHQLCFSLWGGGGPKPQGVSEPSCPRNVLINLQLPGPSPRNTESNFPGDSDVGVHRPHKMRSTAPVCPEAPEMVSLVVLELHCMLNPLGNLKTSRLPGHTAWPFPSL